MLKAIEQYTCEFLCFILVILGTFLADLSELFIRAGAWLIGAEWEEDE